MKVPHADAAKARSRNMWFQHCTSCTPCSSSLVALEIACSLSVTIGHVAFLSAGMRAIHSLNISRCVSVYFLSWIRNIAGMHGFSSKIVWWKMSGDT